MKPETARPAAWPMADAAGAADSRPTVVIEARPETFGASLRALWRYRGFYNFLFKEIMMRRARGTLLGVWWLIIRPLITAAGLVATFMFVAPVETGQAAPYPIFFLSGYIPWRVFQATLTVLPRSLTWMRGVMQRTYFPRLLVPLAGLGPVLIEFAMLLAVFLIAVGVASWGPQGHFPLRFGWPLLWLLPCLLGALLFAMAFGMIFSIVALFFRDVIYTISWVAQLFMFATPVLYPVTFVSPDYRWVLYVLNPMVQIVTVARWALTGEGEFDPFFVALAFGTIVAAFAAGVTFFLRAEMHLGDQL
jgi:lipopolysaccharide transport system permease protein